MVQQYQPPVLVNAVTLSCGDIDKHSPFHSLSITMAFNNFTDRGIVVSTRNGVTYEIDANRSLHEPHERGNFYIDYEVRLMPECVKFDVRHLFNASDVELTVDQKVLRDALCVAEQKRNATIIAAVRYRLDRKLLEINNGIIYSQELDLQFTLAARDTIPAHPFSQEGLIHDAIYDNPTINDKHKFGFGVWIIDTTGVFGDRYMNIAGRIFRIPAQFSSTLKNGIYITHSPMYTGKMQSLLPVSELITFDAIHTHPFSKFLFLDPHSAIVQGDVGNIRDQELKLEEQSLKLEKAKIDRDINQQKIEAARIAHEAALLKLESDKLAAREQQLLEREKRAHDRVILQSKEINELLKIIPASLASLAAIYKLLT